MALVISATRFQVAVRESERICDMALRYEEGLLAEVQQIAACNALHPLQARLARWILQALDRMDRAHLPLTQDLIARMLGVRRTTLTVVASRLQASGLISCHRGRMVILDRYGLEETACDCYRAIRCRREAARERALSTKLEKPLPQVHAHA
jgi:CRP-like cAMP-binding protein